MENFKLNADLTQWPKKSRKYQFHNKKKAIQSNEQVTRRVAAVLQFTVFLKQVRLYFTDHTKNIQ